MFLKFPNLTPTTQFPSPYENTTRFISGTKRNRPPSPPLHSCWFHCRAFNSRLAECGWPAISCAVFKAGKSKLQKRISSRYEGEKNEEIRGKKGRYGREIRKGRLHLARVGGK
ncbi:hypothetical protein NPIL_659311 [Nephila pilipes]|uniref:Uncharacterized protein n=1 Tax=Nephila pilipes TaxID=299642 RepID=A0A8X6TSS3_NEPPI|nr:hypothetical protein NPIL_659311 [Nephila pilipes]